MGELRSPLTRSVVIVYLSALKRHRMYKFCVGNYMRNQIANKLQILSQLLKDVKAENKEECAKTIDYLMTACSTLDSDTALEMASIKFDLHCTKIERDRFKYERDTYFEIIETELNGDDAL